METQSQNEPSKSLLAVISADLSFWEMAEMQAREGDPHQQRALCIGDGVILVSACVYWWNFSSKQFKDQMWLAAVFTDTALNLWLTYTVCICHDHRLFAWARLWFILLLFQRFRGISSPAEKCAKYELNITKIMSRQWLQWVYFVCFFHK